MKPRLLIRLVIRLVNRLLIRPVLVSLLAALVLLLVPCAGAQQLCDRSGEGARLARAGANFLVPVASAGCDRAGVNSGDPRGAGAQSVREISTREIPAREIPTRAELLRRIDVYEAGVRDAESAHASDVTVAVVYGRLASLYSDAAMYSRAEMALEHAIFLLHRSAEGSGELAEDINYLGLLHLQMGDLRQAEREELEALRRRQALGASVEIARSWNALAELYFRRGKYAMARDFGQRAIDEFSADKQANVIDQISSRLNLGMVLCYMKECPSAVPLLKEAIGIARTAFRPDDFPLGEGMFLLGFAYWKSGDMSDASDYMGRGTATMKGQLGWGHPTYLNALLQYAKFLRENKRREDAEVVERQIRQTEAVVDVRSLPTRNGADGIAGLR
jgi:tetratricopeptide (TPR) repeat protein